MDTKNCLIDVIKKTLFQKHLPLEMIQISTGLQKEKTKIRTQ